MSLSTIKQISVFIENKAGRLAEVTGYLTESGINIYALSIGDTTDYGILRLIVDNPEKTVLSLKEKGLTVRMTEVAAIAFPHEPGSLHNVLAELDKEHVSIEYMYAFTGSLRNRDAMVILRLADQENTLHKLGKLKLNLMDEKSVAECCFGGNGTEVK